MTLINKNMSSLRDQSATYRWAYYTPNPWALQEIAQLADQGDFYVGVDVFKVAAPRHATFVDLRANGIECVYQCD